MRIVFLVRRYWPAVGGVEKYVAELAGALARGGHAVTVIAGAHTLDLPAREIHQGVEIRRFPALRSPARCRLAFLGLMPTIRWAEVVHASDVYMLEYLQRMLGGLAVPRCLCMTVHGMSCVYPVPREEILRAERARRRVDAMVHDGNFIGKWLGVTPDAVIPQGLSPTAEELPHPPEPLSPSAVYIGRLAPDTGVGLYLDALAVLRETWGMTLPLQVYGDGPLEGELRAQARRDDLDVRFHAAEPDAQSRLSEHLLAFVSGRMAIHEALARRRAVVATFCNPLREDYVRGEAFSPCIATGGSGAELAGHIRHLLKNPGARIALVERGWRQVRDLSWRRTADAYWGVWKQAIEQRRPRSWRGQLKAWRGRLRRASSSVA